ncbi:MAG: Rieske 2Fe-2S family protein [Gammaproteobacteria bacterium]|jgi:Rieske 2Fe-2S family protein
MNKKTRRKLAGDEDFDGLSHAQKSLPANYYTDPAWYQHELDTVFYNNWVYLCHASTLAGARSFRSFTIGDQGIFLVRDDKGLIHAYYNTCRHRGSAICVEAKGRFSSKLIRCPYHQWAYDFDGHLIATSSHAEGVDFDRADYPLLTVAVKEWQGAIFVSLGDNPADFEAGLSRGADRIDNWPMEQLVVGHSWRKRMQCNWKLFWENFNECLHCPNIHPELSQLVPMYGRRISASRDEPGWINHQNDKQPKYAGGLREGASSWSLSGHSAAQFSTLSEEEVQRGQSYFVSLPSVFIAGHVDYMRSVRILPISAEETEIEVEWLFLPETLEQENFDMNDITEFCILVMQQDAEACELNQKGLRSRSFKQGVLMPEEHHVKAFHDWVRLQTDQ